MPSKSYLGLILLVLSMMFILLHDVSGNPGDTTAEAITAQFGYNNGSIPDGGGSVFYNLSISPGSGYFYQLSFPESVDFDLIIYDQAGNWIDGDLSSANPITDIINGGYGNLTFRIYSADQGGEYSLYLEETLPNQSPFDPSTFVPAQLGDNIAELSPYRDYVYYNFSGDANRLYLFQLNGPEGSDYNLFLYNTSLQSIASSQGDIYPEEIEFGFYPETMVLVVDAYSYESVWGEYNLHISEVPVPLNYTYSPSLELGDTFEWEVFTNSTEAITYGLTNSTSITGEIISEIRFVDLVHTNGSIADILTISITDPQNLGVDQDSVLADLLSPDVFLSPLQIGYDNGNIETDFENNFERLLENYKITNKYSKDGKRVLEMKNAYDDDGETLIDRLYFEYDPDTGKLIYMKRTVTEGSDIGNKKVLIVKTVIESTPNTSTTGVTSGSNTTGFERSTSQKTTITDSSFPFGFMVIPIIYPIILRKKRTG